MRSRNAARAAAIVSGSSTSSAITTPTNDCGNPAARTPASIAGDSIFARPTTATSATSSNPSEASAALPVGASACSSITPSSVTGRKKSRCRTVWVKTNIAYRARDASAANASCGPENSGPGVLVVNVGSTSVRVASVITVASAPPLPSALNSVVPCLSAPSSRATPTMPFVVIMTAAKTVSRASDDASGPPDTISVTIRATSMIVTATARTSDPNGSPTRSATTSAWCTAASTVAASTTATSATSTGARSRPQARTSSSTPSTGVMVVQDSSGKREVAAMITPSHTGHHVRHSE